MKILAIDSSAVTASVAVCDDERRLSEAFVNTSHTHSETLLPMVKEALEKAQMTTDDIDLFVCTVGPGSFTGVRIGVSLIKGLAFGTSKPCVGVSSIEAAAWGLKGLKGLIVPVSDARRCGVYNAIFESDGENIKRLSDDSLTLPEELAKRVSDMAKEKRMSLYFAGDGISRVREHASGARIKDTPELLKLVSAYSAAQAAMNIYESSEDKSGFTDTSLAAFYLRATQAERELKNK